MSKVLVIDDDRTVLWFAEKTFRDSSISVLTAPDAEDGLQLVRNATPDVVLLDIMLPQITGLEAAEKIRAIDPKLPVIFITATDDSDMAIEAMKLGAYDYLLKPLDMQVVKELVERALETRRLMQVPVNIVRSPDSVNGDTDVLVGRSPEMLSVYKEIGRVAAQDVTVLIRGESGTGKELVARAIYQHSSRKNNCFMAVNCAALSDTLLESELFGHEKGAFTGADRRKIGKFEQCSGGTIFLDEIGDMSPLVQSKVLRLLQEQKFERLGGTETIETDVRIISATNRALEEMIEEGEFRLDLFHRLNGFEIQLPPLRKRGEDVQLLIEHYFARLNQQLGKHMQGISQEAMEILTRYSWPGNVRELQNVLRRTLLNTTGPVVVPDFLPDAVLSTPEPTSRSLASDAEPTPLAPEAGGLPSADLRRFLDQRDGDGSKNLYAESLEFMERYLIMRVLRDVNGNQSKAAEKLGITRGSLRNKIRGLGISIDQVVFSEAEEA